MLADVRLDYAFKVIDPAVLPNEKDVVKPKTLIILIIGLVLGSLAALLVTILRDGRIRNSQEESTS